MARIGHDLSRQLRLDMLPSVWCPGCGHGNVARAIATALDRTGLDLDRVVMVGGIGCAGRAPFYFDTNVLHTTHGRALTFATGVKLANPDLTVLVVMGDGDALAIGGNHFIHACRRNLDLTAVVFNNSIYGMTGGQQAPTTPQGFKSTTSPAGSVDRPFDVVQLALAAGATYVARTTTFDFQEMPDRIESGLRHRGFSVVEVLSQCPTYYGRLNRLGDAPDMLDYERDLTVPVDSIERAELVGKIPIGVFRQEEAPDYESLYRPERGGPGS